MDDVDPDLVQPRIDRERAETTRLVGVLAIELHDIIESVSLSNNDDEHDPDGATSGYERAKATAMLRRAEEHLVELDRGRAFATVLTGGATDAAVRSAPHASTR